MTDFPVCSRLSLKQSTADGYTCAGCTPGNAASVSGGKQNFLLLFTAQAGWIRFVNRMSDEHARRGAAGEGSWKGIDRERLFGLVQTHQFFSSFFSSSIEGRRRSLK